MNSSHIFTCNAYLKKNQLNSASADPAISTHFTAYERRCSEETFTFYDNTKHCNRFNVFNLSSVSGLRYLDMIGLNKLDSNVVCVVRIIVRSTYY